MAEFPMMPFWTDAYLGDTAHLSMAEHGAYLLLLISMWRTKDKSLPNDDAKLAKYARATTRQWASVKPVVMDFFTVEGDRIIQLRLRDEAAASAELSSRQSRRAKARWRTSKQTDENSKISDRDVKPLKSNGVRDAAASFRHASGNATPSPSPSLKEREDLCSGSSLDPREEKAAATASDFHSRALAAAGVDATRDVTGKWHSSTQIWTAERWRTDLGLTADEVCAVLAATVARHRNGPIGTLAYFDGAMQDAAGRKQAEPLRPVVPPPKSDAFADRLAAWGIPSE